MIVFYSRAKRLRALKKDLTLASSKFLSDPSTNCKVRITFTVVYLKRKVNIRQRNVNLPNMN